MRRKVNFGKKGYFDSRGKFSLSMNWKYIDSIDTKAQTNMFKLKALIQRPCQ